MKKIICLFLVLFGMVLKAEEKYEIIVLGRGIPLKFDSKRQVLVIEKETIKKIPASRLVDVIALGANMVFNIRGYFQADANIGGFNQEQVLLLIDGIPFANPQTGHHNFNLPVEIEQVERIEIMKIGLSALYHSSGPGGIINIVTSKKNTMGLTAGSFNTWRGTLNGGIKNFSFWAGGVTTDGYLSDMDGKRFYFGSRWEFFKNRFYMKMWGTYLSDSFGAYQFYSPYPSYERLKKILGAWQANYQLKHSILLCADFSMQISNDQFQLFRENPDVYLNHHDAYQESLNIEIKKISNEFSYYAGTSVQFDWIASNGIRQGSPAEALGTHHRHQFSLFGGFNLERKNFFLCPGVRLSDGNHRFLSGHLNGGFFISPQFEFSGTLFRSFRIPTYTELYYNDPSHQANPYLKPEKSLGGEVGCWLHFSKGKTGFKLFTTHSRDLIDWSKNETDTVWVSRNIRNAEFKGFEWVGALQSNQNLFRFSYVFQKVSISLDSGFTELKYNFYIPEHLISLFGNIQREKIYFSPALKFEIEKQNIHSYLNLRLGLDLKNVNLYLDALNLLNERVEKIPGLPEAPRSFTFGILLNY